MVKKKREDYKDAFTVGLEHILNNPQTSFLNPTGREVFSEAYKKSGMSLSGMIRHIGKTKQSKRMEPTEDEKSKQRLAQLEANVQKE